MNRAHLARQTRRNRLVAVLIFSFDCNSNLINDSCYIQIYKCSYYTTDSRSYHGVIGVREDLDARGHSADAVATTTMNAEAPGEGKNSPRVVAQAATTGQCPVCGEPIEGIAADGPTGYTAEPCGHALGQLTLGAIHGDNR